jgi:ABC-type branched-subunit amino acid transport system substrate-binding protein|nr:ABC transporter substrate-binding protein [Anabaena sp. AL09]
MRNFPSNPYTVGTPIRDTEKFFGREGLFSVIEDNLQQNVQLILLYGQRRIGKSSVLKQIPKKISINEFVFINFDFQQTEQLSTSEILRLIAIGIIEELCTNQEFLFHLAENIQTNIEIFSRDFLPEVYKQIGNKKLVFLWDEFDILSETNTESNSDTENFCAYITQLLERNTKLFIILVLGGHLSKLPKLLSLLRQAPYKEIALLDEDNAERLITKPAEGVLQYEKEAIEKILTLSAGNPYFTQVICFTIYNLARSRYQNNEIDDSLNIITNQDVESIVNLAIEVAEGGLSWFWDGLTSEQQVILSAAAKAQKIAIEQNEPVPESPLTLLKSYGILMESLNKVANELAEYGFLDNTERRVKIELVRRWLVQRHRLQDEISLLEKIEEENVNNLLTVADALHKQGNVQAFRIYEQALKLNPNNFRTVMYLAQEYLQTKNINEAFELYNRAYQFYSINNRQKIILQPLLTLSEIYSQEENFERALEIYTLAYEIDRENTKEDFLKTRENYVHKLILEREWTKAIEQCELVLQIDPHRILSQHKLEEIRLLKSKTNLKVKNKNYISVLIISLGVAGIVVFGLSGLQFFRTCPTDERKELGVFCVADNGRISRGDRTFFPKTPNIPRDQGIQAFKKGDYPPAANLFQQAVKANQNDPEVLIYYNNALARQQVSPFTLAVVVPLDKNITDAQEILRGVAQAQNQFNSNRGLNGRLLEIVIANDSNTENAKEVAQELIKDSPILGVIGHNSSDATQAVLPEYEKAKLAVISPTSTSILLNNPVFFRAVYSDESPGTKLAEYTYKSLKLKKAVIFANPNSPYSNSLREVFTNQFEKLGGEVVHKPLINLTASTFNAEKEVAKSVYGDKAEAALLFPDTQSTEIALNVAKEITKINETLRTQNPPRRELKMLGGGSLYKGDILTNDGKNVEGLIIAVPWFGATSQAQPFAKKAEQQWGGGISWRTATSFDATQALIKALSNNPSRSTVLRGLENVSLSANETSGYPLKFTPEREREGQSILLQIKGGKFTIIPNN